MQYLTAALLIIGVIGASACTEQARPEPATADSPSSANTQAMGDEMTPASGASTAADQIAQARCHREKTCGNVGAGEDYESLEGCQEFVRANWKADLDALVCPGGINQNQLEECLTQIRGASCSSPMDRLEQVAACTQRQICIEKR